MERARDLKYRCYCRFDERFLPQKSRFLGLSLSLSVSPLVSLSSQLIAVPQSVAELAVISGSAAHNKSWNLATLVPELEQEEEREREEEVARSLLFETIRQKRLVSW